MISRCHLQACLLLLSAACFSQNWNVFNQYYRYNYKFDNSVWVTQVIFADSMSASNGDTTYYMNRIGVECVGPCYTATDTSIHANDPIIIPNMPQFLQRKITRLAGGDYLLHDTAQLKIIPGIQTSQTWVFDSTANISATCIVIQATSTFGVSDSVKVILLSGGDTLLLSRNFGVLQFPLPYQKNKYFRLAGIEKADSYDSSAFIGERVPNAWDFYRFAPGDIFCTRTEYSYAPGNNNTGCSLEDKHIETFSVVPGGYSYSVDIFTDNCPVWSDTSALHNYHGTVTYTALSTRLFENVLYPGQLILWQHILKVPTNNGFAPLQIVKFSTDQSGKFYKCAGWPFQHAPFPTMVNTSSLNTLAYHLNYGYWISSEPLVPFYISEFFGVGLGELSHFEGRMGHYRNIHQTCAYKNGGVYYGEGQHLDVGEQQAVGGGPFVYPNPVSDKLFLEFGKIPPLEATVQDCIGNLVINEKYTGTEALSSIQVAHLSTGVYFLTVRFLDGGTATKKIVKE